MLGLLLLGVGARTETANADDLSGAYLGGNFGRARNNYDTGNIDGQISSAAAESGDSIDFTDRSIHKICRGRNGHGLRRQSILEHVERDQLARPSAIVDFTAAAFGVVRG